MSGLYDKVRRDDSQCMRGVLCDEGRGIVPPTVPTCCWTCDKATHADYVSEDKAVQPFDRWDC